MTVPSDSFLEVFRSLQGEISRLTGQLDGVVSHEKLAEVLIKNRENMREDTAALFAASMERMDSIRSEIRAVDARVEALDKRLSSAVSKDGVHVIVCDMLAAKEAENRSRNIYMMKVATFAKWVVPMLAVAGAGVWGLAEFTGIFN